MLAPSSSVNMERSNDGNIELCHGVYNSMVVWVVYVSTYVLRYRLLSVLNLTK